MNNTLPVNLSVAPHDKSSTSPGSRRTSLTSSAMSPRFETPFAQIGQPLVKSSAKNSVNSGNQAGRVVRLLALWAAEVDAVMVLSKHQHAEAKRALLV